MNNGMDNGGEDPFADIWITNWERQCEIDLENEPDLEVEVQHDRDLSTQKLWYLFQNSATSVAQLFKDRNQPQVLWLPFQNAAGTITSLYKESTEALRRSSDLGIQAGYQRRTRDVLAWARKRRRHIRREELIAFLTGKSLPGSDRSTHQPRMQMRVGPRQRLSAASSDGPSSLGEPTSGVVSGEFEPALQAFREALSLPPPSSAPAGSKGASANGRRASPVLLHNGSELSAFISHESARHKRSHAASSASPTHDVIMDSPTHKRSRFM